MGGPQSRVRAGVRAGGQFRTHDRAESRVRILPSNLDDVVPEDGRLDLPRPAIAGTPFDDITIARLEGLDSFEVTGRVDVDCVAGLAAARGCTPSEARTWLDEHRGIIEAHLDEEYAASIDVTEGDWTQSRLLSVTEEPCDSNLAEAVEAVARAWGVDRLRTALANDRSRFFNGLLRAAATSDEHERGEHRGEPWPGCVRCVDFDYYDGDRLTADVPTWARR